MCVVGATSSVLPQAGDGTEPNRWTRNMTGVLEAAKATQLPIFLAMVSTQCSHCQNFVNRTLNSQEFASIVQRYRFYMVLLVKETSPDLWETYFKRYSSSGNYPQVVIIKNGTRYTGWSTDTIPVADSPILSQYIEAALAATTTGSSPTTPATTTSSSSSSSSSAASKALAGRLTRADTSPRYALFFFDGNDNIVASAELRLAVSGTWRAKITESGTSKTLRGKVIKTSDGRLATDSSELNVVRDSSTGLWSGSVSGRRIYGKAVDKSDGRWKGVWNIGIAASPSNLGGWMTATVGTTGRMTFSGKISNKTRISGNCYSAVFPAAFVSTYIPRWAGKGDVCFGYAGTKAGVKAGCVLFANGTAGGNVSSGSQGFDVVAGSRWDRSKVASLSGKSFRTVGAGNVTIPVVSSRAGIAAGANDYGARIRCNASRGQVSATYRLNNQTYKATGIIYAAGKALGGGNLKDAPFTFIIE